MVKVDKNAKILCVNILVSLLVVYGLLAHIKDKEETLKTKRLKKFTSCKEIYRRLKSLIPKYKSYKAVYLLRELTMSHQREGVFLAGIKSARKDGRTYKNDFVHPKIYSKTNVQVKGVDEPDIVKTDGNYIYIVSKGRISIMKAFPPQQAKLLSIIPFSESEEPLELFIEKNKLLSISTEFGTYSRVKGKYDFRESNFTVIKIYDISDRSNPILLRKIEFEGNYTSSRKIDSFVYLILTYYPHYTYNYEERSEEILLDSVIPKIKDTKHGRVPQITRICRCENIQYMQPIETPNFLILASISLEHPYYHIQKQVVMGASDTIYASVDNIYVANNFYDYLIDNRYSRENKTNIYKFSVQNGNISYRGMGEVPGRPLNQFAMDEKGKYFRIVTQNFSKTTTTNIYILNANLSIIGKVENLAMNENLHFTRFFNDRLYMVTYRRIDPLFVIDLSNPTNPKVLGELKIPGFSEYLHPYDESHIIGFGKDTTDTPQEWAPSGGIIKGLKVAIFDVSDPQNPKQKFVETLGDSGSDSLALRDHRAFLFDKEKELLIFPAYIVEKDAPQNTFSGAYIYNINLKNGFTLKGKISHYEEEVPRYNYSNHGSGFSIVRTLYIDNFLYTISERKMAVNKLDDLAKIIEIGH